MQLCGMPEHLDLFLPCFIIFHVQCFSGFFYLKVIKIILAHVTYRHANAHPIALYKWMRLERQDISDTAEHTMYLFSGA